MLLIKALDSLYMRCLAQHLCEHVILMKLTEKQKNCPYCHPGSKVNGRECWYHTTLALGEAIDSCTYTELYFDPINRFLEASNEDELFIDINYCPMCGRPLNEKEE